MYPLEDEVAGRIRVGKIFKIPVRMAAVGATRCSSICPATANDTQEGPVWPIAIQSTAVPQINTIKLSNSTCHLGRRETPYRAIGGTLRGQFVLLFKIRRMVPRHDIRIGGAFVHRSTWVKWLIRGHNSAHHRMSLRCTDSWGEGMPVLLS